MANEQREWRCKIGDINAGMRDEDEERGALKGRGFAGS